MGPIGLGGQENLTDEDALALQRELPGSIAAAVPSVRTARPAIFGNNNWLVGDVRGVGPEYLQIKSWNLERGRYFNEQEVRGQAKVCIIGKTVQDNLVPGGEEPVGQTIRIGKMPFEIIGILERKGGGPMAIRTTPSTRPTPPSCARSWAATKSSSSSDSAKPKVVLACASARRPSASISIVATSRGGTCVNRVSAASTESITVSVMRS